MPNELILLGFLLVIAIGGYLLVRSDDPVPDKGPVRRNPMDPSAWEIGPINDRLFNWSKGYDDPRPSPHPDGWMLEIGPEKQPHYLTYRHGPLTGKSYIRIRYRAECAPETVIHGQGCVQASPSAVVLYFERPDENGTRNLSDEGYRWWATFAVSYLTGATGEVEVIAPLNAKWTSVVAANALDQPELFAAAVRGADRVGFTFANCEGYGHGATATGPVRFIVTEFAVE